MDDLWISDLKFALQGQKHGRWETISNGVFFCRGTTANTQQCKKLTAANKKLTKKLTADPIG